MIITKKEKITPGTTEIRSLHKDKFNTKNEDFLSTNNNLWLVDEKL